MQTKTYNIGSSDYSKHKIQPWDIWKEYNLDPWDADIIKRVLRTKKDRNKSPEEMRIEDYQKIIHICKHKITELSKVPGSNYIDLGLPSGTLWKTKNEEGFFSYDHAIEEFGNALPTKEQLLELTQYCTWTWKKNKYLLTGPNGNSIILPAKGLINEVKNKDYKNYYQNTDGVYCSSTQINSNLMWGLYFTETQKNIMNIFTNHYLSVRLCKNIIEK